MLGDERTMVQAYMDAAYMEEVVSLKRLNTVLMTELSLSTLIRE
jgi:hypothetical protein